MCFIAKNLPLYSFRREVLKRLANKFVFFTYKTYLMFQREIIFDK